MGGTDIGTLRQALAADDSQKDALIPVVEVYLVAGLEFHALLVRPESLCFSQLDAFHNALSFGLTFGNKFPIPFGKGKNCFFLFRLLYYTVCVIISQDFTKGASQ